MKMVLVFINHNYLFQSKCHKNYKSTNDANTFTTDSSGNIVCNGKRKLN